MSGTTDREMIELAAKAANMHVLWDEQYKCFQMSNKPGYAFEEWNPLSDDGDALRLFVKLRMDVTFLEMDVFAFPSNGIEGCSELINMDDPYAATRRAITRAAAEIGWAMAQPTQAA